MDATFADLTDDVADIYTAEELEAMIAFFDTPTGPLRSRSRVSTFGVRMQAVMMPHLVAAFSQLGEKYCARFGMRGAGRRADRREIRRCWAGFRRFCPRKTTSSGCSTPTPRP
jgi:hypothetical protein